MCTLLQWPDHSAIINEINIFDFHEKIFYILYLFINQIDFFLLKTKLGPKDDVALKGHYNTTKYISS